MKGTYLEGRDLRKAVSLALKPPAAFGCSPLDDGDVDADGDLISSLFLPLLESRRLNPRVRVPFLSSNAIHH
jgi:hypothetical protein